MIVVSAQKPRRPDWLDALWRFASSGRATWALLLLVALTLMLATLFPQVPVGLDRGELERQLGRLEAAYRDAGPVLRMVGVFTLLQSPWLRVLLALLAYNLALRLADQILTLGRAWRSGGVLPPARPDLPVAEVAVAGDLRAALAVVEGVMRPRYPRLLIETAPTSARLYGQRGQAGAVAGILLILGLILALVGLAMNLTAGWRSGAIPLTVGSSAKLPFAGGLQITLKAWPDNAMVSVVWADGRQADVAPGVYRPARAGDLWVVQTGVGPALAARAMRAEQPLRLQALAVGGQAGAEIRVPFRQAQTEQAFALPSHNLTFRAVSYDALPAQGIAGPVFLVEAYRGDDPAPLLTQLVEKQAVLTVDDVVVDLRRDRFVLLAAAYLPGLLWWAVAALLLVAAAGLTLRWNFTESWVHVAAVGSQATVVCRVAAAWRGRAEARRLAQAVERAVA